MKALVWTAPRQLEYKDWPDPELDDGEALVRVRGVSICGSDLHGWLGHSRGRVPPLVLGHELAGEVVEVRGGQEILKTSRRVAVYPIIGCGQCRYCCSGRDYLCGSRKVLGLHVDGGLAECIKAPVKNLYPIPEKVNFAAGALVEPLACGLHMAGLAAEEKGPAVVLGAGPIGLAALLAARRAGFPKIAVSEINAGRRAIATKLGADLAVNPQEAGAVEALTRFFGEEGCAVVFDAAGFAPTRQLALKLVRTGGLIVLAGLGEQETALDCVEVIRREIRIAGSFAYNRQEFQQTIEWVASGRVSFEGWVSEAPLAEGQSVFEELVRPDARRIKVVLKP